MMRLGVLVELLAIIALIAGVPVALAGTVALIAATPTSAVAIYRTLKTERTAIGAVDVAFLFFTWAMIPCLLLQHATGGVGENVFRFIVSIRIVAAVSIWRHSSEWHKRSNDCDDGGDNRELKNP